MPGDTLAITGENVDRFDFDENNARVTKEGGKPAIAEPLLVGYH